MEEEAGSWSHRTAINDLATLRVFAAVVEAGSFTEAGRRLRIVPSTVSKHIAALEAQLKSQLITRSTQRLSVTELGYRFYDRCRVILQDVEDAEREVSEYKAEAQGLLRVSAAPVLAGRHLVPMLDRFLSAHPKVRIELNVTTLSEDLVGNGLDAAIRISNTVDPSLVAVKLADNDRIYCATPAYLERHGRPATIADLVRHNCLVIRNIAQSPNWPMRLPTGDIERIHVSGNFVSNDADTVLQALLLDLGIGHIARFLVHDMVSRGQLIELFPQHRVIVSRIFVVFPKRRDLPLKTRAFIDHLKVEFHHRSPWVDEQVSNLE